MDLDDDDTSKNDDVDDEAHRDQNHNLVGCKVKAFYPDEGVWFEGVATWYNTNLEKVRVLYEEDGSDEAIYLCFYT